MKTEEINQMLTEKTEQKLKIRLVGVFLWRRSVSRGPSGDGMGRNWF